MNEQLFEAWLDIHRRLHKRGKWKDPDADEYRIWRRAFARWGLDFDTAVEISEHLYAEEGEIYPEKTLPAMRRIHKEFLANAAKNGGTSVNGVPLDEPYCHDCGGSGQAVRFPHDPNHKAYGQAGLTLACECGAGRRWKAANPNLGITDLRDQPRLRRKPVPWTDLEDGLDNQFRYRPSQWDEKLGRPKPVEVGAWRRDVGVKKDGITTLGGGTVNAREMRRKSLSVPLPKSSLLPLPSPGETNPVPGELPSPAAVRLWPRHADIRLALDGPNRAKLDAMEAAGEIRELFDGVEKEGLPTDSDIATVRLRLQHAKPPQAPPPPEAPPAPPPSGDKPHSPGKVSPTPAANPARRPIPAGIK